MTDGVLVTNTTLAFNKSEKESGQAPSKLRMTADTIASFKENIDKGKIPAATEKFNIGYQEMRQALIAAETEAAEQQVRSSVMMDGKTQADIEKEKAQEMANLREEQIISRLSSVQVVKPKLDRLKLEPTTPELILGKNEKGLTAAIINPPYAPKALMVPLNFGKIYKKIGKNSSLYKLADSIIEQQVIPMPMMPGDPAMMDPTAEIRMAITAPPPPKVANWRGLFDNSPVTSQIKVIPKVETREEEVIVPIEQKGLTKEELSDRKMKAQIGDELAEIRRLQKGMAGTTPFSDGLIERENTLLQMLGEISGIEIKRKTPTNSNVETNATEFQRLIDDIIGYKKPLTIEEHEEKEKELEEHYSKPEVVETMKALQLKNILYDLNTPESYAAITEAERKDNEIKAAQSTALELLDQTESTMEVEFTNLDRIPAGLDDTQLKVGAEEQAKALYSANVQAEIKESAEEQAKLLIAKEKQEVAKNEQARRIQQELRELRVGAEEQARALHNANVMADIKNGAEEQAKALYNEELNANMQAQAAEQAKAQEAAEMIASIKSGAIEQARALHNANVMADIKNGAEEQAKALHSANVMADIKNGAEEQAKALHSANVMADIKNGAEEQAKALYNANVMADIKNGAEEQAKALYRENEMIDLKNGAEEQAKKLIEQAKQEEQMAQVAQPPVVEAAPVPEATVQEPVAQVQPVVMEEPKLEALNLELTDVSHRYGSIISPSKPIKVNQTQIGRMRKAKSTTKNENVNDVKDMLVSLKEQLEELGLGNEQEETYQNSYSLAAWAL